MRTSEPNLRRKWLMTSVAMQDTMAFDKGRTRSRVKRVVCVDVHQLRARAIWHCLRAVSVLDLSARRPGSQPHSLSLALSFASTSTV